MHEVKKAFPPDRAFNSTALHSELKARFGDLFESVDTENDGQRLTLLFRFHEPLTRAESQALSDVIQAHDPVLVFDAQAASNGDLAGRVAALEVLVAQLLEERR